PIKPPSARIPRSPTDTTTSHGSTNRSARRRTRSVTSANTAPCSTTRRVDMGWWVGTSGYAYPEWRGSFYPEKMQTAKMLPYYAERFPTVEINNTFYRMPNAKLLEGWSAQTPEHFKLTLKAPQRITHQKRLRDCADEVKYFLEVAATLRSKLGAIMF